MKGGKSKADATKKAESKLSVKKKGVDKPKPVKKAKAKAKAGKDPNKPKRPPSAFFVFMEEFRVTFKKKNPDEKQVSVVGKAGGVKWKSLSDAEKAPYVTKANKLKAEYEKKLAAYNTNPVGGEESDKPKSEVNDEEGSEEEDEVEDEDDD